MLALLLLLLLHHATARDSPQETPIVKKIGSCPEVGYYFHRESGLNAIEPVCHLCFCQEDDTAVCWRRELRRCDAKHYQHYRRTKRLSRVRRNPGFSDIFFSDAAKDVFNKNTPEECQPYEASYSEGCPPADWCIGCTVCDCNANGRWDCHVLSFCDDKKGKKRMKKKRGKVEKPIITTTKKLTPKTTQKPNKIKPRKKSNKQPIKRNQGRPNKMPAKPNKGTPHKEPVKKRNTPSNKNKSTPKSKQPNNKIVRTFEKTPSQIVEGNIKTLNGHEEIVKNITHAIFKKVMDSVEKIIRDSQKNITHVLQQKFIQKRSMPTQNKPMPNFKTVKKGSKNNLNKQNVKLNTGRRSKREIPAMISSKYYSQEGNLINATDTINVTEKSFVFNTLENDIIFVTPKYKISTKPNYFQYTVDVEQANVTRSNNLNSNHVERFLIHNEPRNASSKATSNAVNLKINTTQEEIHGLQENKRKNNPKLQTKYIFKKDIMNMSYSQIINHAVNENITNYDSNFTSKINITCGSLCKFKKIFKMLIGSGNTNTTMPTKNKINKFNILKYLKRIFRKVFIRRTVKYNNTMKNVKRSNRQYSLIRTICQNFGSCNVHIKNKKIAHKIDQLRAESKNIMQSVRSIKGLLKLLDIHRKKTRPNSIVINGPISDDDIEKLNAIIKDNYDEYNLDNLTETQRVQVSYIKQNTKIFMQSMENFAEILNDIVQILTNRKSHYKKFLNHYYRNPKKQSINKTDAIVEKLDKIKGLLTNYNLVQNKFMKRMYDVIKTLGPETNQTTNNIKVSNEKNTKNDTVAIEIYTQNIIENLRKLKNLVRKLSFKNRRKREAMDDTDVVEYLLILMEYLLKQQKQLKTSPANDGIDLLIEAIKSAPDIKATRKKVLDYIPVTMEIETTQAASKLLNAYKIVDETNATSNVAAPKFKTFESIDEDDESRDYYQYNTKFHKKNNFKKGKFESEDIIQPLTTLSSYIKLADDENTNALLDKMDTKQKYRNKAFEIFIDDTDDDDGIVLTTTKPPDKSTEKESITTRYYEPIRTSTYNNLRDEHSIYKGSNDTHSSQHNRIKLDWIEDSYTQEDEHKELLPRFIETTTQKLSPTHTILVQEVVTRTSRKKGNKLRKYDDPISSISRETEDEDSKGAKTLNAEYVMYKKQMDLLNSLDYGTEKIEMEEDSTEEKSNVEQFPTYFV